MALDKFFPKLASSADTDVEARMSDIYTALNTLRDAIVTSPGEIRVIASVAINKGQAVSISSGQLILADAATNKPCAGISLQSVSAGAKCRIMLLQGYVSGLSGLTANSSVYLGNAGAFVYIKPGAGFIQGLGYTLSATEMLVNISNP